MTADDTARPRASGTMRPADDADGELLRGEAAIIAEFFVPLTRGDAGAAALADDCAVISPAAGTDLVVTTDSLIEGVHFLPGDIPSFKALAVNVSDLVADGATPERYLLNLALSQSPTRGFMRRFAEGLEQAQTAFGCRLVGGDTDRTPGPLTITITAIGSLPAGTAVRRSGARPGDLVVVSGTIGDAGLGLLLRRSPEHAVTAGLSARQADALITRHERPHPHVAAAALVRAHASAAMDVSDGLPKDLHRLTRAARVGADVGLSQVPMSDAARILCSALRIPLAQAIAAGEDYELLMSVPPGNWPALQVAAAAADIPMTVIGTITAAADVVWRDAAGDVVRLDSEGWDHF